MGAADEEAGEGGSPSPALIARLANDITEDPHKALAPSGAGGASSMSTLTKLLDHPLLGDLAMKSLTLVYSDILPSYRLRTHPGDTKVSKEERKLRVFENRLLAAFSHFSSVLMKDASAVSTKCMLELLKTKEGCNFYGQMLSCLVKRLRKHGSIVAKGLGDIVEADKRWQASSMIVGEVAKYCTKAWKEKRGGGGTVVDAINAVSRVKLKVGKTHFAVRRCAIVVVVQLEQARRTAMHVYIIYIGYIGINEPALPQHCARFYSRS